MHLRKLYLHNFRCYDEAVFEFSTGINSICGPNAKGKTSILEAIHFLLIARSFRTSQPTDLIKIGSSAFHIEAIFVKHGIEQTLKISFNGKERTCLYNSTICQSTTDLLGLLQGVVITPDDVGLVKSGPPARRQFLDMHIAQVDPLYVHHLTRYNRALRQRNTLLRAKSFAAINSWEYEMAHSAAYLTQQRHRATEELEADGRLLLQSLSDRSEELSLSYKTGTPIHDDLNSIRQHYLGQFQKLREREMALGFSLVGPHKDDLIISIDSKEARYFASEGQQRSCVAALRFAEWNRLNKLADEVPLMLIDDVGTSLDERRQDKLMAHIYGLGQVFLTSTEGKESGAGSQEPGVNIISLEELELGSHP